MENFLTLCNVKVGSSTSELKFVFGQPILRSNSKIPVVSGILLLGARNRVSEAEVEQRGDSPVLVMHDGVTKSIFVHLIPAKGVYFPSCEKVVKIFVKYLYNLGYSRVVFRCDNEASILAFLRAVKLAWTGDVVHETSAEGDPQSNGAAESSVNVVKGHFRWIKLAVESASGVEVQPDHDLLTWLVPYAASMHRRFVGRSRRQDSIPKEMWEDALFLLWRSSVSECGGCFCSHLTVAWAHLDSTICKQGRYL